MSITIIALKITLVPALIMAITLVGRRWGASVAGWLTGFPMVAGPILYFIAIEQGASFAATASINTLLGVLAALACNLGYAWAAMHMSWRGSLLCGVSLYGLMVALLSTLEVSMVTAAAVVFLILLLAPRLFPQVQVRATTTLSDRREIFVRMLAGAILVLLVTYFASMFGPRLSGLLAVFPVISIVLAVFSHRHCGHSFAIHLLRGVVFGWYAFLTFCFVLGWALPAFSVGSAFLIALACTAVVQVLSRKLIPSAQPTGLADASNNCAPPG